MTDQEIDDRLGRIRATVTAAVKAKRNPTDDEVVQLIDDGMVLLGELFSNVNRALVKAGGRR